MQMLMTMVSFDVSLMMLLMVEQIVDYLFLFLFSLRRGPGANIQDSNGYSALHYASLNGHTDCVKLLLMHEASANLPDNRGSSPLHLAAWAGHQEIVKLLLTQSNRPANPNLQVNLIECKLFQKLQVQMLLLFFSL